MNKFHPFQQDFSTPHKVKGKEKVRDPLDVRELLTSNARKAIITEDGELKLQKQSAKETPSVELMKERYWGAGVSYHQLFQHQLTIETRAMRSKFPSFQLRKADQKISRHGWQVAYPNDMFWLGSITTYSGVDYLVAAVYPKDYPFGEIRTYILDPYLPTTEHRFQEGHLCLYDHQGKGQGFESGKSTVVTVIAWTAAWLHAYEIWQKSGSWPSMETTEKRKDTQK